MPTRAEKAVVRISLRSMFALTLGIALLAALAGQLYRDLDPAAETRLLYFVLCLVPGMGLFGLALIKRRKRLQRKCQPLLFQLPARSDDRASAYRWLLVVALLPLVHLLFAISSVNGIRWSECLGYLFFLLLWGWFLFKGFLSAWTEGYADTVDICEAGVVIENKFFAWESPHLNVMGWHPDDEHLCLQYHLDRMRTIPVPSHQREAVDAIIEHYYLPAH